MLQDQPEMAALLGQKARRRVLERYTLNDNITRLERLYAQVVEQPRMYLSSKA